MQQQRQQWQQQHQNRQQSYDEKWWGQHQLGHNYELHTEGNCNNLFGINCCSKCFQAIAFANGFVNFAPIAVSMDSMSQIFGPLNVSTLPSWPKASQNGHLHPHQLQDWTQLYSHEQLTNKHGQLLCPEHNNQVTSDHECLTGYI